MANVDGESPNFDELKVPSEGEAPVEPPAEIEAARPTDEATQEPIEAESESVEVAAEQEEVSEEKPKKDIGKLPLYLEWGGVIAIPVILLILAFSGVLCFSTALYVISVGFVPYGIWKGRETNNVYTVVLGCALIAVLTAIYCLWMEVGRYQFDIKAQDAKRVSVSAAE